MKIERFRIRKEKDEIIFGVISDTHIPTRADHIPAKVFSHFKNVDYIIHAGDFVSIKAVEELTEMAPVFGVRGNMDLPEVQEIFPDVAIIKVGKMKIGVYHGSIFPFKNMKVLKELELNCLVHGHTHMPKVKKTKGGFLFVNPGSPTNPIMSAPSIAILKVKDQIEAKIISLI